MNNRGRIVSRWAAASLAIVCLAMPGASKQNGEKNEGPVVTSINAPLAKVKKILLARMGAEGFTIEAESEHQVVAVKDTQGGQELSVRMMIGGSTLDKPQSVLTFGFFEEIDRSTTLTGHQEVRSRLPFGRVNRVSLDGGKARRAFAAFIDRLKEEAEQAENKDQVPLAPRTATVAGQPVPQTVALSPTPDTPSTVVVKSTPDNADITVDGKFVGSTPSTLKLGSGEHKLTVGKSGFRTWERTIALSPAGTVTINPTLEQLTIQIQTH